VLVKDPSQRPTSEKLLTHKFIKNAKLVSYLTDLLDYSNPNPYQLKTAVQAEKQ